MYLLSENNTRGTPEYKTERFREFIMSEMNRKKKFLAWQESWKINNANLIKIREEELKTMTEKEEEAQKMRAAEQAEEKTVDKVERKGPQPGKLKLYFSFEDFDFCNCRQTFCNIF